MFFRNLTLFRITPSALPSMVDLRTAVEAKPLRPCAPLEMATCGFVPPFGDDTALLQDALHDTPAKGTLILFAVGREEKILPAATLNQALRAKVRAIGAQEQRPVGGRERRRLKSELLDQLLPRALARPSRVAGYIDTRDGWVVLDTPSRKVGEAIISTWRDALGSFPALPVTPQQDPRQALTQWLATQDHPDSLSLDDECELHDLGSANTGIIRCSRQPLDCDEVQEHLRNHKQVTRLGMSFQNRIGFVLDDTLTIRKLRFYDVVLDELDANPAEDQEQEQRASFLIMHDEIRMLLNSLSKWFDILPPPQP